MAIILGILYLGQEENQVGIQNINGALFLMLTNMTFSNMFSVVNVFCAELPIFLREHFNGMYRTDVYFLSKQIVEFPIFVITPILFCAIFYFMVGMNAEFARFCIACLVLIAVTQVKVVFSCNL
jgi:ABC-type multidrug transport system permease subunit